MKQPRMSPGLKFHSPMTSPPLGVTIAQKTDSEMPGFNVRKVKSCRRSQPFVGKASCRSGQAAEQGDQQHFDHPDVLSGPNVGLGILAHRVIGIPTVHIHSQDWPLQSR